MAALRKLTAADYDSVLAVWQRAGLPSLRPDGRDSRAAFARQLSVGQVVLGLEESGRLIGCVAVTHDARKGWINRLAVEPDHRRKGHGLRLVRAAEDVLREQGLAVHAALIEDWNEASLALFQKAGYAVHRDILYVSRRDSDKA